MALQLESFARLSSLCASSASDVIAECDSTDRRDRQILNQYLLMLYSGCILKVRYFETNPATSGAR